MSTAPVLSPQIIGQAENAHRPLMERILARTGTTFRQWVTLTITAAGGGIAERDQLVLRMTGALKIDRAAAATTIAELAAADLIQDLPGRGSRVRLTDAGQARYDQVRAAVDEVTARLYGGIPAADLATAGRVLALVTARANAELAEQPATGIGGPGSQARRQGRARARQS